MMNHTFRIEMDITVAGDEDFTADEAVDTVSAILDSIEDMSIRDNQHSDYGWDVDFWDPVHTLTRQD